MRSILLLLPLVPLLAMAQDSTDNSDNSDNNAIHAVTAFLADGTKTVTVTDPDKHSSECTTYDAAGKFMRKIVYALDENNDAVSGVVYDADDQPAYKTAYKRDNLNRIGEEDDFNMNDQLLCRFVYEFAPDGKVARVHEYDAEGNE
ncbi:MAG: hypothetical protein ABSE62_12230, partial [Chthoniobacteraceae bacterium]